MALRNKFVSLFFVCGGNKKFCCITDNKMLRALERISSPNQQRKNIHNEIGA